VAFIEHVAGNGIALPRSHSSGGHDNRGPDKCANFDAYDAGQPFYRYARQGRRRTSRRNTRYRTNSGVSWFAFYDFFLSADASFDWDIRSRKNNSNHDELCPTTACAHDAREPWWLHVW